MSDPEELRRARIVTGIALIMIVMCGGAAAYTTSLYGFGHVTPITLVAMTLVSALSVVAIKRDYRIGAYVLSTSMTIGELAIAVSLGGIHSPQLVMLGLLVLFCGFLLGAHAAIALAAVCLAGVIALFVLDAAGMTMPVPKDANPELTKLVLHSINIVSIAAVVMLYESSRRRAFGQLAASEANLGALIGNTADAIWSVDRTLRTITENAVFQQQFAGDARAEAWRAHYERALAGEHFTVEIDDLEVAFNPIRRGEQVTGVSVFARDISERKRQARRLDSMRRDLLVASRMAGVAEMATGVLHEIGNALNSVTVSANVATTQVREHKAGRLAELADLLERAPDAKQLSQVAAYLRQVASKAQQHQTATLDELGALERHIEQIGTLVAAQEAKARTIAVIEEVGLEDIIDGAVQLAAAMLGGQPSIVHDARANVQVRVDRYKVTQIVSNLLANAARAVAPLDDGRVTVHTSYTGQRLGIEVIDNGVAIAPEHATRIFAQGFTCERGRGGGLHWSANAAKELGGTLTFSPAGVDRGARFRLEVPI